MQNLSRRIALAAGAATLGMPYLMRPAGAQQLRSVIDTLATSNGFTRFTEFVQRAGLTEELRGAGPFTLFAPTDAAFASGPTAALGDLLSEGGTNSQSGDAGGQSRDPVALMNFVSYYVIPGQAVSLRQLAGGDHTLRTKNGAPLLLRISGNQAAVTNPSPGLARGGSGATGLNVVPPAMVQRADIPASNGLVQVIGGLVFPA